MTMIDEEYLTRALNEVAAAFDVSAGAQRRIVEAAQSDEAPALPRRLPTFLDRPSHARSWLVAAALAVIVAGVSVPLLRSEGNTNGQIVLGAPKSPYSGQHRSTATSPPLAPTDSVSGQALTSKKVTGTGLADTSLTSSTKIESTGSLALRVGNGRVNAAFSSLATLATRDGGYVERTSAHGGSRTAAKFAYGTIVLQVPQRNFAKLVRQAEGVGHTTSVNTSSNDVTAQYVDLQAHLTALEASRRQYLAIMTRATTISGILAVQSQLDALQSQIEQLQGQLNVLTHETTYGTLSVTVSQSGHHAHKASPLSGFAKAWHDSVKGFVAGFEWLLRLAGPVLFAVIAVGGAWVLGKLVRRSVRRRRI